MQQHGDPAVSAIGLEQRRQTRRHVTVQHLDAGGTIHVGDGGELLTPLWPYPKHTGHEAPEPDAPGRQLEIPIGCFDWRNWRKRTELFAVLDVPIEPVAHLHGMGRSENAAMAERARAELA